MKLATIKTETKYQYALAEIEKLMGDEEQDRDRLELLVQRVCSYEDKHYPIEPPPLFEAIKFRVEQMGISRKI